MVHFEFLRYFGAIPRAVKSFDELSGLYDKKKYIACLFILCFYFSLLS